MKRRLHWEWVKELGQYMASMPHGWAVSVERVDYGDHSMFGVDWCVCDDPYRVRRDEAESFRAARDIAEGWASEWSDD